MRLSIRTWTILALNAFVVAQSLFMGSIARDVAGRVVEERFAREIVTSVSGFLTDRTMPVTDTMMKYLRQMLHADWIALNGDDFTIIASSLPEAVTQEFARRTHHGTRARTIELAGAPYRFEYCDVRGDAVRANQGVGSYRFFVLLPEAGFREMRDLASSRVAGAVLPATGVATLLAVILAFGTTRPIRRLTREMDRMAGLSEIAGEAGSTGVVPPASIEPAGQSREPDLRIALVNRGPNETRQLASSFYGLLDRLAAARDRLTQNDRLATLGRICLSVAHELRNPLSGIKMNMRVLQDRITPSDDPGVAAILREIGRMELYLDELMTLSPGTRQRDQKPRLAPAKLSSLADSVLLILSGRCRHSKVVVQRDYPAAEPCVQVDANQIRQAMMNFVVNAIEAMPAGGTMTVSIRSSASVIKFAVADTGKGVEAGGIRIFEAFGTAKPNGVGLGLYLSKQIIGSHGGRVGFGNRSPGAEFWFELSTAGPVPQAPVGADAGSECN